MIATIPFTAAGSTRPAWLASKIISKDRTASAEPAPLNIKVGIDAGSFANSAYHKRELKTGVTRKALYRVICYLLEESNA